MKYCSVRLPSAALAALTLLLAGARADAENRWPDERQAGRFLCHADFSLADEQPLLDEVSRLQTELGVILGAPPSREPVHLFLFQAKTTYQTYLEQYFPRVPNRRALFIKSARGPGMVFACQGTDFDIDVRHESTHALLHAWLPDVPLWLDEGLAEYFEVPRTARAASNPHQAAVQTLVRSGSLPRLSELEAMTRVEDMGRSEYRDAWAWVHFMLHGPPEARLELQGYLSELAARGSPDKLSDRLRRRLPDLNRRIAEHFR